MTYPTSRNIKDLCVEMQGLYALFEARMKEAGIDYIVTCTYRNNADQDAAYAQGRTAPGKIVTNARAGESRHNCVKADLSPASQAFDICIMIAGKCDWDSSHLNWRKAGIIGRSIGLEWAGDWVSFKEYPHFQLKRK